MKEYIQDFRGKKDPQIKGLGMYLSLISKERDTYSVQFTYRNSLEEEAKRLIKKFVQGFLTSSQTEVFKFKEALRLPYLFIKVHSKAYLEYLATNLEFNDSILEIKVSASK